MSRESVELLFDTYCAVIVRNQAVVARIMRRLNKMFARIEEMEKLDLARTAFFEQFIDADVQDVVAESEDDRKECDREFSCSKVFVALRDRKEVVDALMECTSSISAKKLLLQRIDCANTETHRQWLTILSLLPRITDDVRRFLRPEYILAQRGFWKMSCIVHTCGSSNIARAQPDDELIVGNFKKVLNTESTQTKGFMELVAENDLDPEGDSHV